MKAIIVTGSVCTGKTTYAKKLAKEKKWNYINVGDIIDEYKLSKRYDKKLDCKVVDVKDLVKVLIKLIKESKKKLVIDGHLSHYIPKKYVEKCIVMRCDISKLKKRLEKRKYSKFKIRQNLDVEIFDLILEEAKELGHKIKVVDTSKTI